MEDSAEVTQPKQECASLTCLLDALAVDLEIAARRIVSEEQNFLVAWIPRLARERFAAIAASDPEQISRFDISAIRDSIGKLVQSIEAGKSSVDLQDLSPKDKGADALQRMRDPYWSLRKVGAKPKNEYECSAREKRLRFKIGHLQEILPSGSFPHWEYWWTTHGRDDMDDHHERHDFCSDPIEWPPTLLAAAERHHELMERHCAAFELRSTSMRKIAAALARERWDAGGA